VSGVLECYRLPEEARERLEELRDLSEKAEKGGNGARQELRQKLRESSAEVVIRASDISRKAQRLLIQTASGGDPLTEDALSGRLDMMRAEIAGENPTPLETLLTERVVACWLLVELFDALMSAQLWKDTPREKRMNAQHGKFYLYWQDLANRRFLASVQALARVRKLQSTTPGVQVNTQINLGR
jgi:hypothetical protein